MFLVIFWTALVRYTWPSNSSRFFFFRQSVLSDVFGLNAPAVWAQRCGAGGCRREATWISINILLLGTWLGVFDKYTGYIHICIYIYTHIVPFQCLNRVKLQSLMVVLWLNHVNHHVNPQFQDGILMEYHGSLNGAWVWPTNWGDTLRPFLPQLQTTYVKCLSDPPNSQDMSKKNDLDECCMGMKTE